MHDLKSMLGMPKVRDKKCSRATPVSGSVGDGSGSTVPPAGVSGVSARASIINLLLCMQG
jgi:hypothetical protein